MTASQKSGMSGARDVAIPTPATPTSGVARPGNPTPGNARNWEDVASPVTPVNPLDRALAAIITGRTPLGNVGAQAITGPVTPASPGGEIVSFHASNGTQASGASGGNTSEQEPSTPTDNTIRGVPAREDGVVFVAAAPEENGNGSPHGSQTPTITPRSIAAEGSTPARGPMSVSPNVRAAFGLTLPRRPQANMSVPRSYQRLASSPSVAATVAEIEHREQHLWSCCTFPGCEHFHQPEGIQPDLERQPLIAFPGLSLAPTHRSYGSYSLSLSEAGSHPAPRGTGYWDSFSLCDMIIVITALFITVLAVVWLVYYMCQSAQLRRYYS